MGTSRDRVSAASKVLGHPLTLLLLGGVLTAVVGPFITRAWQNHERALEVKSELVDQMSQATAALMTSVQVREFNPGVLSEREYLDAFRQWDERSQVIDARLATYFPGNEKLGVGWRDLSLALVDYFGLASYEGRATSPKARGVTRCPRDARPTVRGRSRFMCAIGIYLGPPWDRPGHWRMKHLFVRRIGTVEYRIGWRKLKYELIDRRDQLVREVIASDASV
jgi:hypothetical protein